MRRTEAVIEQPMFPHPIDTTTHQGARFGDLISRYADATQFVSSFEGLRSFPSYAEIVRRRSLAIPQIARTLGHRADAIGLVLAFEDIQANLIADGFQIKPVTEGATTLGEKRERILGWAEGESIIPIRSAKERIKAGNELYGYIDTRAYALMTDEQRAQYNSLVYHGSIGQSFVDLVLPDGQETTVLLKSSGNEFRSRSSITLIDRTEGSGDGSYTATLISTDTGKRVIGASFHGERFPGDTVGAVTEIRRVAKKLLGQGETMFLRGA